MTQHTRIFSVERSTVDPEAGTFEAVLFTDGEASDGHILSIKGGKIPERMPLFVNHAADPTTQLGSLYYAGKGDHEVRVRGEIMLDGEGAPLEVRRDLLAKMAAGHVSRMSGRWDADDKDAKRRVNLPSDHPAFVDEKKETESRKRWGYYFEKWQAMEGSVVGLGADPQAVMRWARDEDSPECVRDFWKAQVPDAQRQGLLATLSTNVREIVNAGVEPGEIAGVVFGDLPPLDNWTATTRTDTNGTLPTNVADDPDVEPEPADAAEAAAGDVAHIGEILERLRAIDARLEEITAAQAETDEELTEIADEAQPTADEEIDRRVAERTDEIRDALTKRLDAFEQRLAGQWRRLTNANEEQERGNGDPLPPIERPRDVIAHLRAGLAAARREGIETIRAEISKARGGSVSNGTGTRPGSRADRRGAQEAEG